MPKSTMCPCNKMQCKIIGLFVMAIIPGIIIHTMEFPVDPYTWTMFFVIVPIAWAFLSICWYHDYKNPKSDTDEEI